MTCTFTNTKQGAIIVDKVTIPAGDPQLFDFNASWDAGTPPDFQLTDASAPYNSGPLAPGSGYSVSETVPAGWSLTSATCSDGSPVTNINLAAGETVTCTFTNTKQGAIIVDKVTIPAGDPQLFDFNASWDAGTPPDFQLTDASAPYNSGPLAPGSGYSVSETVPAGWSLTSATCSDGSPVTNINLAAGETVTCTFTNTKRGSIIVEKQTNPANSAQSFAFTGDAAGSIADNGQIVVSNLMPGTYTSTEAVTPDWVLDSIVCDDGQSQNPSSGSLVDRKATFKLDPGETVKCTFTNLLAKLTVVKTASPQFYTKAGEVITYTVTATNTGAATLTNVGVTDVLTPSNLPVPMTCNPVLPATLAPGAAVVCTGTYTITQSDIENANSVSNSACATSAQTSKPVCDDETVRESKIAIVKTSDFQTYGRAGDVITYSVKVTNIGDVPLTELVVTDVVDPNALKIPVALTCPNVPKPFNPGQSFECTGQYTISQVDVDRGSVLNAACVDSTQTDQVCDDHTINAIKLVVDKTASEDIVPITDDGVDVTFTFVVTNTSNVPAEISRLRDSDFGKLKGDADCKVGTVLQPGASCEFQISRPIAPEFVPENEANTEPHENTFTACVAPPGTVVISAALDPVCDSDDAIVGFGGGQSAGGGGGGGGQPPTDMLVQTDAVATAGGPLGGTTGWILWIMLTASVIISGGWVIRRVRFSEI